MKKLFLIFIMLCCCSANARDTLKCGAKPGDKKDEIIKKCGLPLSGRFLEKRDDTVISNAAYVDDNHRKVLLFANDIFMFVVRSEPINQEDPPLK